MGALIRAHDWAATPLGPPETWPQSLKTIVGIMLNSKYPMFIGWGEELTMFYNDAYRPILGALKHPQALGASARHVWAEIWDILGPLADRAVKDGEPTWSDDQPLMVNRHGYVEETYFTFSYSPIRDDTGGLGGMFCACTETTERVIGERRLRSLSELGSRVLESSVDEACERAAKIIERDNADVPFALIYLLDDDGAAKLACSTGLAAGHPSAPLVIDITKTNSRTWPLAAVANLGRSHLIENVDFSTEPLPGGPWPEPASGAFITPLGAPGQARPAGFLIAGISPRRRFDEAYGSFLDLAAGRISMAIANAVAYQAERKRAEALAEIDRAKTAFFSNVSHEFRTPLTLMLGPLEEVLADPTQFTPAGHERVRVVHRNGLRLLKLVNTLLDFSRIEASRVHANFQPLDLAALTTDLVSNFRSVTEKAGLRLVVDCPPLPVPVHVDRDMWEKIVLNLISNAFKFTFEGEIAVDAAPVRGRPARRTHGPRHRHRHTARRDCRGCSSAFIASKAPRPVVRRQRHRSRAGSGTCKAPRRANPGRKRGRPRQHFHGVDPGAAAHRRTCAGREVGWRLHRIAPAGLCRGGIELALRRRRDLGADCPS